MKSVNNLYLIFILVWNIMMAISVIIVTLRENNIYDYFGVHNDFYEFEEKRYVRIPFIPYKSSKDDEEFKGGSQEGYCEVGELLIQWGISNNTNFSFHVPYGDCFGVYIIPKGGGGGNEGVAVKEIGKNNNVSIIAGSAERPYYWFSLGKKKDNSD